MDTQFNVFEIMEIAEEVERRAAEFYRQGAVRAVDGQRRQAYIGLARWRIRHQQAWARLRREYSERTGEFGTFDPDNYVLSNPQVMAGLAGLGTDPAWLRPPTGQETCEQILRGAIQRSRGILVFYHGLKDFARDPNSQMIIDNMISEEDRHCRLLARSLDRTQAPPAKPDDGWTSGVAQPTGHAFRP